MIEIFKLPAEILFMVIIHLSLVEYHRLRYSSNQSNLPILTTVTWDAYVESISRYSKEISHLMKPKVDFLNDERLEMLYNHKQFKAIHKFLSIPKNLPRLSNDTKQELFFRTAIDGLNDMMKLLMTDTSVNPAARDDFEKRLSKKHLYSPNILLIIEVVREDNDDNDAICYAAANGHYECVVTLWNDEKVKRGYTTVDALRNAAYFGHADILLFLLSDPTLDPSSADNYAIQNAAANGHLDCVKLLMADKRVNPSANQSNPLRIAAQIGHAQVVEYLLKDKRVDPAAVDNSAICLSAELGHTDCVKVLLKDTRVDPTIDNNYPLRIAFVKGHPEAVIVLKNNPKVMKSLSGRKLDISKTKSKYFSS
ncbi:hypothetical protein HDV02_002366 [Globomyces sp. JEL0801]|nr:hypothetical protein HDV02_002366 [Globomyces sp. JEL0801]